MSRHSTFPIRPPSEQLCDLHVYKVPLDLWRAPFNNILNQSVTETVSLGIIRVPPDIPLCDIRGEIEKQLEELAPKEYVFLRSVGRSITRVKGRQEYEWTAKQFLPPKHYAPELYLLEATPELRDAFAISDGSSQLSPISMQQGSPGARSYRNGYGGGGYPSHRQGYPDESRSHQRHGPDKTAPFHRYSPPLPQIKPRTPSHSSPDPGGFLADTDTQMLHSDRNTNTYAKSRPQDGDSGEGPYGGDRGYKSSKEVSQTLPREAEADSRPQRHLPIDVFYGSSRTGTDPSPPPLDHGSSPRSPSPGRKGAGSKSYTRANGGGGGGGGGYEREAAYTNNTNEDSGVAGMSPDNQYKHRDHYYRAANSKPLDHGRYKRDEDEDEKRRLQDLEERSLTERSRWAKEQDDRRQREEENRQREEDRRRAEEEDRERRRLEEEEERRGREEEERRRLEDGEEDRRREQEKRRLEDEEEQRRRNEDRRREEEEEDRLREEEDRRRKEDRRREEEEDRRREEEEERRRREEEERLKISSEGEADGYPSSPQNRSPSDLTGHRETDSSRQRRLSEEQRKLLEELQEARDSRHITEKEREDLVKKAKTLQSKTQNRRNLARDVWKKRYFEEKKKTPPLEDQTSRLREELDALHRRRMAVLEGPKEKNVKAGDNRPSQKNNYIIQCTRLQHDIDDLKRRVENAKMKLTGEMKLRTQAEAELRAVRAEAVQKKISMRGQPFQVY